MKIIMYRIALAFIIVWYAFMVLFFGIDQLIKLADVIMRIINEDDSKYGNFR